ncbi:fosmidomycin resistance protein [Bacillus thuringiensis]|uniref:VOC family protein n=1 Tax=Bacillus thuringiensis TaxID=1428 RepID=UPI000BEBA973|nr:VOC family protein [Bacillus thuringiensis]PDX96524.1 fosmidomycin resistance protein [Bacillus thuringiensis]
MINGLHETHLEVADLERSIKFYKKLGLELGNTIEGKAAFFIIGERGRHQTLGLWKTEGEVHKRHFAFDVNLENLRGAKNWLNERKIETKPALGRDGLEPIVHAWTPAASIYFDDPDGNKLKFYSYLTGKPKKVSHTPTLSEWENEITKTND